jgi:hypothetical protein
VAKRLVSENNGRSQGRFHGQIQGFGQSVGPRGSALAAVPRARTPSAAKGTGADPDPAGIEYAGVAGASKACQDAVLWLIQWGDRIVRARILSCGRDHCLLLTMDVGDLVAVKSGFASGYAGEGPRRFSYVLQVLDSHRADIEEYNVAQDVIERLDQSALTTADLEKLDASRPVRPSRWHHYVLEDHCDQADT